LSRLIHWKLWIDVVTVAFFELSHKKATQNLPTKVVFSRKSTGKVRKTSLMHRKTPE